MTSFDPRPELTAAATLLRTSPAYTGIPWAPQLAALLDGEAKMFTWFTGPLGGSMAPRTASQVINDALAVARSLLAIQPAAQSGDAPLLDPDCRDGKCGSCVGGVCECPHHNEGERAG